MHWEYSEYSGVFRVFTVNTPGAFIAFLKHVCSWCIQCILVQNTPGVFRIFMGLRKLSPKAPGRPLSGSKPLLSHSPWNFKVVPPFFKFLRSNSSCNLLSLFKVTESHALQNTMYMEIWYILGVFILSTPGADLNAPIGVHLVYSRECTESILSLWNYVYPRCIQCILGEYTRCILCILLLWMLLSAFSVFTVNALVVFIVFWNYVYPWCIQSILSEYTMCIQRIHKTWMLLVYSVYSSAEYTNSIQSIQGPFAQWQHL
jgi:hypothetical protein